MTMRSKTITTNLYELISAMHETHGDNSRQVAETITYLAASGKIRWLIDTAPATNIDFVQAD